MEISPRGVSQRIASGTTMQGKRPACSKRHYPLRFDAPVVHSIDPAALLLALAAAFAIFRMRAGVITALLATSIAALVLHGLGAIG
jgi:hypothetical protein